MTERSIPDESGDETKLLFVARPPGKISEMSTEDLEAWVEAILDDSLPDLKDE